MLLSHLGGGESIKTRIDANKITGGPVNRTLEHKVYP